MVGSRGDLFIRLLQRWFELPGRHGLAEQVALQFAATGLAQQHRFGVVLDAFGHHAQAERVAQADDGLRDRQVGRIVESVALDGASATIKNQFDSLIIRPLPAWMGRAFIG